jgi:predicted RNase H-like HicB family nuclease
MIAADPGPPRRYRLHLESGPRHRKTLVHVPDLLGCVSPGPTTESAVEATPTAIRAFLGFLARAGEPVDPDESFEVEVAEHLTEGIWLGNGSPYATFGPDRAAVDQAELERLVGRFRALHDALAAWTDGRSAADLDAPPPDGGRTARAIIHHVLGPVAGYLTAALPGAPGVNSAWQAAERGEISLGEALRRQAALAGDRLLAASDDERRRVVERPKGDHRSLRKALRRMLEHDWEHLAELARRPGGPRA